MYVIVISGDRCDIVDIVGPFDTRAKAEAFRTERRDWVYGEQWDIEELSCPDGWQRVY